MMTDRIEIANLTVYRRSTLSGALRLHVEGSGPLFEKPLRRNDWLVTNFLALVAVGVHLGYLIAAVRLVWRFRHEIRAAGFVLLTGHSLGGATVEVAAVLAGALNRSRVQAESYGGPAPFWVVLWPLWKLAAWALGVAIDYYVAGTDPIPFVPFWNVHLGRRNRIEGTGSGPYADHVRGYRAFFPRSLYRECDSVVH